MSKRRMGRCVLCNEHKWLCFSHIIPEAAYGLLYDDPKHHRFRAFSSSDASRVSYPQKGFRSYLLCESCETLRNERYEKPFNAYWLDGKPYLQLRQCNLVTLDDIDYDSFKLYHLSILLLAHHSSHEHYSGIRVSRYHAKMLRRMIYDKKPGFENEYPIACAAIDRQDGTIFDDLIVIRRNMVYGNVPVIVLTFAGCRWLYFVTRVRLPAIEKICLKKSGTLPVAKRPYFDGNFQG